MAHSQAKSDTQLKGKLQHGEGDCCSTMRPATAAGERRLKLRRRTCVVSQGRLTQHCHGHATARILHVPKLLDFRVQYNTDYHAMREMEHGSALLPENSSTRRPSRPWRCPRIPETSSRCPERRSLCALRWRNRESPPQKVHSLKGGILPG